MTLDVGVIGAGTHGARYLRHLVRGDVPGLRAVALCRRDEDAGRGLATERQRQVLNPVVEDLFLARAELDDGCWASLEVSKYTQSRAGWLEAVGEAGQLMVDYQQGWLIWRQGHDEVRESFAAAAPTLPAMLAGWRDAVLQGTPVPVSVVDGLRTLEVVDACYRSAQAGAAVSVGPAG